MLRAPRIIRSLVVALAGALLLASVASAASDAAGGKDYPGIGRFKGSSITGYVVKNFDAMRFQAAPFKDGKPTDARRVEGRVTRIAYRTHAGPSILEVSRNFETQLAKAGFETLVTCDTDACGGIPFTEASDILPMPLMNVDGFNYHYYAGHQTGVDGESFATLFVSSNNNEITAELNVANVGAMKNSMVDAAAMAKGLGDKGHVALYGIYFDTDQATLKPESAPTLAQIAKLLNGQPSLHVFIVGHTDNQGSYDHNLDLSRRRAAAVAAALTAKYHIAAARMRTAGVGLLAPVASNASSAGRALNRRVELVQP